ncbi:hypothetical protein ACRN9F_20845 [Shewanella oncorhynchi]|uniref:hypothetical protein n=1 Tax=Shewanella oncorhynchi TaxID=2726434 RepID=UPI003D793D7D
MNTASEIRNKEKSLIELMVKILKEPLNPLERSLSELKAELDKTGYKLHEVDDNINFSLQENEKMSKMIRKIKDEDFPSLTSELQQYLQKQFESESKKITNSLDNGSKRFDASLNEVADAIIEKLTSTVDLQSELKMAIEELRKEFDFKIETLMKLKQSVLNEIQSNREQNERSSSELSARIDRSHNELLTGINDLSVKFKDSVAENMAITQQITQSIHSNQKGVEDNIGQQHAALIEVISGNQVKLKNLMFITTILLIVMVCYIGYDLWSRFN